MADWRAQPGLEQPVRDDAVRVGDAATPAIGPRGKNAGAWDPDDGPRAALEGLDGPAVLSMTATALR